MCAHSWHRSVRCKSQATAYQGRERNHPRVGDDVLPQQETTSPLNHVGSVRNVKPTSALGCRGMWTLNRTQGGLGHHNTVTKKHGEGTADVSATHLPSPRRTDTEAINQSINHESRLWNTDLPDLGSGALCSTSAQARPTHAHAVKYAGSRRLPSMLPLDRVGSEQSTRPCEGRRQREPSASPTLSRPWRRGTCFNPPSRPGVCIAVHVISNDP